MEGESDRREDEDSSEARSDGLDDYRSEIREKYPESSDDNQGKAGQEPGEVSEQSDRASDSRLEDTGETEGPPEQPSAPSDSADKAEPKAESQSDATEDEDKTSEKSEPNTEPENQGELEQLRDHVKEKYPHGDASEGDGHESERGSQNEEESAGGSDSQAGSGDHEAIGETPSGEADAGAVETAPQDSGHKGVAEADGKPPSDGETDAGRTIASQSEGRSIEAREEIAEESKAPRDGAEDPDGQREDGVAEEVGASEVHDGGAKIDSSEIDLDNGVEAESTARLKDSDGGEDSIVEQTSQLVHEDPRKDDDVSTPQGKGDESAAPPRIQEAAGEQATGNFGIDGASQAAEDHNWNASVEVILNQAGNYSGEPRLPEAASMEHVRSARDGGEPNHFEQPSREQREAEEPRPARNQPQADAAAETAREKGFSLDQSQAVVESRKGLNQRQADSRETVERPPANNIADSTSAIEGKRVEKTSAEERTSRREVKIEVGHAAGEPQTTGESQTPSAKEAGAGREQSAKFGKEVADLESVVASDKNQGNAVRKESSARTTPLVPPSESEAREYQPRTDNVTQRVDSPTSTDLEPVNGTQESQWKPAAHSPVREEQGGLKVPDVKEVRERQIIESTLRGEQKERANFVIRRDVVEDVIGEKMEKGKEYDIRFRIDGVGDFKTRHVERGEDRILISLPKEGRPENLRFGEKHRIEIYSVEERRDFNVIDTKEAGPTVKISRTSLESWGFGAGEKGQSEKRILDLEFRNTSRPEQPTTRCFAAYDGKREGMNLRLRRVGAKPGDVFRLEEKKEYRIGDFLRDFDKHKAEALKNAKLLKGNEGLQLEVDGRSFALMEPRLDAYGLRAVLSAKIESTNRPIRFTFDGERVTAKLSIDTWVIGLKSEHGLAIKYDQGGGAIRTFRLFDSFDAGVLSGRIRPIFSPEKEHGGQGDYIAESDSWLGEHVRARFSQIYGKERLAREKGDISEEIARSMLSMSGQWDEVADHPFAIRGGKKQTVGPDSLQRLRSSGELHYFEFKWWNTNVEALARLEAERQALRDCINNPTYKGENIVGAYIGLLEWDVRSKEIRLKVERVSLEDE